MKKLFGGINLTWKKLIIFAVIAGAYTALMALLPFTKETSFRDIAIQFEWWILFGIIIISNCKKPLESALKCFVFFLISQPLVYLIQVPFSHMGWNLFGYYRYWFIWTLACLPMGFIGYYINKKNLISVIILLPMLIFLAYLGLGYFTTMMQNFPHHLLSFISCFLMIIVIVINLFEKTSLKVIALLVVALSVIAYIILKGGITDSEYETYRSLDNYGIKFVGDIEIVTFTGTSQGSTEIISSTDEVHSIKIKGRNKGKYTFTIVDETKNEYEFEYYYDKEKNTVVLNLIN